MELRLRVTRKRAALAVAVFALIAAGAAIGVTSNAYTDANGMYKGCVEKTSGILRVLTPTGQTCRNSEVAIDWNQVGPQGPQGLQGIQGPKGDKGDTGAQGPEGPTGPAGADGEDGAPGAEGQDGEDGVSVTSTALAAGDATCANGGSKFTAVNGVTYACNGSDGEEGAAGAQGPPGPPGSSGSIETTTVPMTTTGGSFAAVWTLTTYGTLEASCDISSVPARIHLRWRNTTNEILRLDTWNVRNDFGPTQSHVIDVLNWTLTQVSTGAYPVTVMRHRNGVGVVRAHLFFRTPTQASPECTVSVAASVIQ